MERLVVASGKLSASAHKNASNPLHLDWDFYVMFEPLLVGDTTYNTAMHVEIETRGVWQLNAFAGMNRHDTEPDFNIGSFYLFDHRSSSDTRFRVHSVSGTRLEIEARLLVHLGDSYIKRSRRRKVHVRAEVQFEGILVSSYGVQSQPDKQKLMRVAGKLFDVSAFAPPKQVPDLYGQGTLNLHFDPKPLTRA